MNVTKKTKQATNWRDIVLIVMLIFAFITLMVTIITTVKDHLYTGNADLKMKIDHNGTNFIDFTLSNPVEGMAFIEKIELISNNFKPIDTCTNIRHFSAPINFYSFDTVFLQPTPETHLLDGYKESDLLDAPYKGWVSKGLKYSSQDDVDTFRIFYVLGDDFMNLNNKSYGYDLKLRVSWCNAKNCEKKRVKEETFHIENVVAC